MTETLHEPGYGANTAADGNLALKVLEPAVRTARLIANIGLPGALNGCQMMAFARQSRPRLSMLLVTGQAENAIVGDEPLVVGMHLSARPLR